MTGTIDGSTKFAIAQTAVETVVGEFYDRLDFGMQVFPLPNRCEPGEIVLDVGPNSAQAVIEALGDPPPSGGNYTPMQQTLLVAADYPALQDATRDNHLILITDGWQWCGDDDPRNHLDSVDAVQELVDADVTVHVIGFGASVDTRTLNRAAVVGGTARAGCDVESSDPSAADNCYHQADDLAGLLSALDAIATTIVDEACDGFDNDCDGEVDEGFDIDQDTFTRCGTVWEVPGTTDESRIDCVDNDAAIHPDADEICDMIDNNCDGIVDPGCACSTGATSTCGLELGECTPGVQTCVDGSFGECEGAIGPTEETCNGLNEDCDGAIDEGQICPTGFACLEGACIDTTPEAATPAAAPGIAASPAGGCACRTTPSAHSSALAGILLLSFFWARRPQF